MGLKENRHQQLQVSPLSTHSNSGSSESGEIYLVAVYTARCCVLFCRLLLLTNEQTKLTVLAWPF